jgi:pimeloyl-ACP methyl ester carboxylesterase
MNPTKASRGEVIAGGKRLETLWIGPTQPNRATIVMLHEGLGSIALWKDFPERLAERTGCGVLVYSRYGHGNSDQLMEKRPVDFMHHEGEVMLPELLAKLEIDQPILLGHSDGASISIIFAGKYPDAARCLILEAPHVFVEDLTIASIEQSKVTYQKTDLPAKLDRYHAHVDATFWGWNDIWLDPDFRRWNIESYLAAIRCPVLCIQGEDDEYGTAAQVEAIKAQVPQTEIMMLPDCKHSPHRDQAEQTLDRMAAFIEEIDRSEAASGLTRHDSAGRAPQISLPQDLG